MQAAAGVK